MARQQRFDSLRRADATAASAWPSISLSADGVLRVRRDDSAGNTVAVRLGADGRVRATVGTRTETFAAGYVTAIVVAGGEADHSITVDLNIGGAAAPNGVHGASALPPSGRLRATAIRPPGRGSPPKPD